MDHDNYIDDINNAENILQDKKNVLLEASGWKQLPNNCWKLPPEDATERGKEIEFTTEEALTIVKHMYEL
tara:strand:+ start:245 stop:454 length:210 start_codon:yes stop_codon:yes gene_type:complete